MVRQTWLHTGLPFHVTYSGQDKNNARVKQKDTAFVIKEIAGKGRRTEAGLRIYIVPLGLVLPLQNGCRVERRGAPQLLLRDRRRRRRREGVRAVAGEESRLDAVHRGRYGRPRRRRRRPPGTGRDVLRWPSAGEGRNHRLSEWMIAGPAR